MLTATYVIRVYKGSPHEVAVNIRLYVYGHEQAKLRKKRWNNKEILLKINK
jgi:hypothetical protein